MKIPVDLGDGIISEMDSVQLDGPFYSVIDNDHEHTTATEYRLDGRIVHRSVNIQLKQGIGIEAAMGRIG